MTDARVPVDVLLAHADWVRELAHAIVRSSADADDVSQETLARAVRSPPASDENLRGWFRRVMHNVIVARWRKTTADRVRDLAVARPEAQADSAELVERAEALRLVVAHVLELKPESRDVVLMRYFEDLGFAEIAARLGANENTVKSRHQRAIESLRKRLSEEHGLDWPLALAPLLRWNSGRVTPAPGPTRGRAVRWSAAALVTAGLLAAAIARRDADPGAPRPPAPGAAAVADAPAPPESAARSRPRTAAEADATAAAGAKDADALAAAEAAAAAQRASRSMEVTVAFSTDDGSPVPDLRVVATAYLAVEKDPKGPSRELAAPAGRLAVSLPRRDDHGRRIAEWRFVADHPEYLRLERRWFCPLEESPAEPPSLRFVLARAAHLVGTVRFAPHAQGDAASVHVLDLAPSLPKELHSVPADAGGAFRLKVPPKRDLGWLVRAPNRAPTGAAIRLDAGSTVQLGTVELGPGAAFGGTLAAPSLPLRPGTEAWIATTARASRWFSVARENFDWTAAGPVRAATIVTFDDTGRFFAGGFPATPARLSFVTTVSRYSTRRCTIALDAPREDHALAIRGTLLRVRVSVDGAPLAKAGVTASAKPEYAGATTDDEGCAAMLLVPGLTYAVAVDDARGRWKSDAVTVTAGPEGTETTVELAARAIPEATPEARATCSVRLRGLPDGVTVAAVKVSTIGPKGEVRISRLRNLPIVDGRCVIDDIAPGLRRIVVQPGAAWCDASTFLATPPIERMFAAGEAAVAEADVTVGGRLSIAVRHAAGAVPTAGSARVFSAAGERVDVTFGVFTDEKFEQRLGNLARLGTGDVLEVLAPGTYRVDCEADTLRKGTAASRTVVVEAGRRTDVEIVLE